MLDTAELLFPSQFPAIQRGTVETLQVNLGYLCNQSCNHCHVNAGPKRTELMSFETIEQILQLLEKQNISTLDLTGGAPEMNPHFQHLVEKATALGVKVLDRCNLTILQETGYEQLAEFLAQHRVEVIASLPCYLEENVDSQRGGGVFESSIAGIKKLNALGYGMESSDMVLNLVYNPQGPSLPPPQGALQQDYKKQLSERFGIQFNQLFTITNMPISRFGSMLLSKGEFHDYMNLLKDSFSEGNLQTVMCRNLLSIDWQGHAYDCDFNQMLGMGLSRDDLQPLHISDLLTHDVTGWPIKVADHCYGCTAGQGSSCGGALLD